MDYDASVMCVVAFLIFVLSQTSGSQVDLTVDIPAGQSDCFYQTVPDGARVSIYYEVLEGGDLDVDTRVEGPHGMLHHRDSRESENDVQFTATVHGDHRVCFDNSFSLFSNKVVWFEMIVEKDGGHKKGGDHGGGDDDEDDKEEDDDEDAEDIKRWKSMGFEGEDVEGLLDMTVQDFMNIMKRSKINLDRSIQLQRMRLVSEARDMHTVEANLWRVNHMSLLQMGVMFAVSFTQVMLIRKLFSGSKPLSGAGLRART